MFRPCPEDMANSGPNMAVVETFFPNSISFSKFKSQLAPFTFSIATKLMFWPCPDRFQEDFQKRKTHAESNRN